MNNIEIALNKKKLRQIKYAGGPQIGTDTDQGLEIVGHNITS